MKPHRPRLGASCTHACSCCCIYASQLQVTNPSNNHVWRALECHRCSVGHLPGECRFGRDASAHSGRFALKTHRVLGLKCLIPIIISGVLAIYGLIVGVILVHKFEGDEPISDSDGCRYLAGGLLVGFACLSSGVGMGLFLQPPRHHGPFPPPFPPTPPPPGGSATTTVVGGEEAAAGHGGGLVEPLLSMMGPPVHLHHRHRQSHTTEKDLLPWSSSLSSSRRLVCMA